MQPDTFFCGSIAGICQVCVGHPFDTLKVRLQAGASLKDALSRNIFKGITYPLLGISFCNAVVFTAYHNCGLSLSNNPWIAGAIAGAIASLAYCPMELYKIRKQLNVSQSVFFIQPYRGWRLTLLREVPSFSAYFGTHEVLERWGYGQLISGGISGMAAWIACYPQDVIKTWYQGSISRTTIRRCIQEIHKAQGIKGFFRGLTPALLRSFPANAVTFTIFEYTQNLFRQLNKEIN